MKTKLARAMLLSLAIALSVVPLASAKADWNVGKPKPGLTLPMVELKCHLMKLWIEHGLWTHKLIVSDIAGLEDKAVTLARLLRNQEDIGNAIKPYYGKAVGEKYTELLKEHIVLAGKLVDALKAGNQAEADKINKEWYRNADDIAKYLSGLNPNWPIAELKQIWEKHLQLVTAQAAARLAKQWDKDVAAFDQGQDHLIHYADVLSAGIIRQFPKKF